MKQLSIRPAISWLRHLALASLLSGAALTAVAAEYTASFKGTDINEFINIVGKNLNKTIIIDPAVRGKINVRSYDLLNDDQYYQFFLNVLEVYGYAAVEMENNIVKIVKDKDAKFSPTPVVGRDGVAVGDEFITRVVPVHNVSVRELAPLLRQLNDNAGGGNVVHYDPSNVLMITGRAAVVNRLVEIVDRVDQAGDQHVDIVDLEYASAGEMVRIVESLNRTSGGKNTADFLTPKLVADDRTNSVIVSGEEKARVRIVTLIQRLDKELASSGNTRVFYLKYANAEDLVKVLEGVSDSISSEESGGNKAKTRTRNDVNIESHEDSNALVITAEPSMMQSLETVIRQLDIRRAQVHIEAIIVEIMEGDGASLGIQYFSEDTGVMQWNDGTQVPVSGLWAGQRAAEDVPGSTVCTGDTCTENPTTDGDYTLLASLLGQVNGMMMGVIEDDWAAVIQAVKSSTNSNILSTPSVTTLDNQEAYFIAGQDVPILTGSTASSNNANPFQTIERQEVGVKLKVTPQINEGDAVQLVIEQEVSSISGTTSVDITINKRELKTTVMADNGDTVVLGGLIDEDAQESESKVPFLGDIPVLGKLFTSTSTSKTKRNLLVFIRPTIVRDAATMNAVSSRKYNFMRALQLSQDEQELPIIRENVPVLPEYGTTIDSDEKYLEYLKSLEKKQDDDE
ncbi:type II secretion system secretin GspD [Neiella marina]|uniref:Type II secretion system secretin GspD n=1 Tax=Neiella holothuriorum TaxID=2870530 RepID=A0ABS7EFX2_9GAMM|nr:type II secretion system secretin GspD [Neiella holothuriorum]MBW8191256.1 type II secretion system secretin GspD [Neiella holothuriorum]